ncbi:glycosyltransferase [Nocardioides sp. CF8]|uniref:glycosyltransferase n=1 Tax=Nocardioides sp. CF8 TaxID=110319 RepID=UPI00056ADD03|nr:glycosyltransferase [Nocardioides sp. CF8]
MRILVEALCAEYGGIRTYVDNLLPAWMAVAPDDEVHVMVQSDSTIVVPAPLLRHDIAVRGPQSVARPLAQTRHTSRLVRELRPDVVLATLPSTTVRRLDVPLGVVVYDLRHELRPEQFERSRRLLRWASYGRGYATADGFVSISHRTLSDLHALHPATADKPAVVAHLGGDHVDDWPHTGPSGRVVTFAHHTNKNLDLVLDGWQHLGPTAPELLVLGVSGDRRTTLEEEVARRGLAGVVTLAPFLDEGDFRRTLAGAALVLFPSDFEGFGLPVVEGMRLGVPVVIGPEPATREVAGGHAFEMSTWQPDELARAVRAGLAATPAQLASAREHAAGFTWANTVTQTRALLTTLLEPAPPAGRPG